MKVRDLIKLIERDGWYMLPRTGGSHQYKHPVKKGRVTIPVHGGNEDLPKGTEMSILKQAGLK